MRRPNLSDLPKPPKGKTGWPWTDETEQLPVKMSDGSDWPKISIVTSNYNYGHFIEETIRSVLLQGYPNLEYIIVDGGSTDNSVEIIKKYEPWLTYWVSEKDNGQASAINKGFSNASGEIYSWINSDDLLLEAIQKLPDFLKSQSFVLTIGKDYRQIDQDLGIPNLNLGYINEDHEKVMAFSASDLILFPTRADNLPLVLLESMVCGTPLISFRVGGVTDLVHPGIIVI